MSKTQLLQTFIKQIDGLSERLANSRQETQQLDELVQSHFRLRQENEQLRKEIDRLHLVIEKELNDD